MKGMRYTVVLRSDPETPGVWLAEVPALPWCVTFGHSPEEALENARTPWRPPWNPWGRRRLPM